MKDKTDLLNLKGNCKKAKRLLPIIAICLNLSGCYAAVAVPMMAAGIGLGVATIVTVVNLARDQYPNIDFEEAAPVEVVYRGKFIGVWEELSDTLITELGEQYAVVDKESGIIRTQKKNLNDVSWIGKAMGKATFDYEYNIIVRRHPNGIRVKVSVPFWEEKAFIAEKEKNIPEGSNMMRHILFSALSKNLSPVYVLKPDRPDTDIRRAPLTKQNWDTYKEVYEQPVDNTSASDDVSTPASSGAEHDVDLVKEIQQALAERGYDPGPADGQLGRKTKFAIQEFQLDNDLEIDGNPSKSLLRVINGSEVPVNR